MKSISFSKRADWEKMTLSAGGSSSPLPALGMLAGMLLLGFAGVVVVMPSTADEASEGFLPRQLQAFGYITTSRAPSSFDSSDSSSSGSSLEPSKSFMSGSMESSDWNNVWPKIWQSVGGTMGHLTFSLVLQVIFAVLYYNMVVSEIVDSGTLNERMSVSEGGSSDFANGICACHQDKWVCLQGLCCPMVRIAHTNAVGGVCPFWESLWCWCCCAWLTLNIGPFCLLMWWRLRLKTIMRLEDNPINDFIITMFCPQVSICQMSTAADRAMGYEMSGCCSTKLIGEAYE